MNIQSLFTHPGVVIMLYDLFQATKGEINKNVLLTLVYMMAVNSNQLKATKS